MGRNEENLLKKQMLVDYMKSGCRPRDEWRIGAEYETLGFDRSTLEPLRYDQIERLLEGLANRFGWERVMEGEHIIGLWKNGKNVCLEGGGQVELSGAQLKNLHCSKKEVDEYMEQVQQVGKEMGVGFIGPGFQPKFPVDSSFQLPKKRFRILHDFLSRVNPLGLETLCGTCAMQANLDFSSEEDMVKKYRVSIGLQPIATAIFANSPFKEGNPNGSLSYRSYTWQSGVDDERTGDLPLVFRKEFGFDAFVEYALDVPMYFAHTRDGDYVDCSGMSFRDFMVGKLPVLKGQIATLEDWENHLKGVMPDVRLRRYLEMRGADSGPRNLSLAVLAFWVGLLYDEVSLDEALKVVSGWSDEERAAIRDAVPKKGLKAIFRGQPLRKIAEEVYTIARDGLVRRGIGEECYLDCIEEVVKSGVTPAERLLHKFEGNWGMCVDPVFQDAIF